MKRYLELLGFMVLVMFLIGCDNTAYSQVSNNKEPAMKNNDAIRVRFTANGQQAIAVFTDNPTTRSMLSQLPITVKFEDFANTEKIAYFPHKLSTDNAPKGYEPAIGDITCYGPWGNLAIFYKARSYSKGLIYMGKFESGFSELAKQGTGFMVTVELVE